MRLILLDRPSPRRSRFYPLALGRPIWELRSGMTSLAEKLVARLPASQVACFVPPYLAAVYRRQTAWPVNDVSSLADDDLLLVDGRAKVSGFEPAATGPSQVVLDADGDLLWARIVRADLGRMPADSIDALVDAAVESLPRAAFSLAAWQYTWELVAANPEELAKDFRAAGRRGIEGTIEEPVAIRGARNDIYVARDARIHPMTVLDAEHGPIYVDHGAEILPFTRIEGPCYIGRNSRLLGAKCRAGNSIGPVCRVGGEVEHSILQGYANKAHDGFLGHAYVGQWVNLGADTTNSDLKNDYSNVSVVLDGRTAIDTGSTKVGCLIGDHAKTSIGTLLNTGAYLGAMTLVVASGKLLPKFVPSFAWLVDGAMSEGFGLERLYQTARTAMGRRGCAWTDEDRRMWDEVFTLTARERSEAIARCRRQAGRGKG